MYIYLYIFLYTTSAAQRLQGRSPFQPQAQVKTCCEPGTPNLRLVLKRHSTVPILRGSNLMQILWSFWGSFFEGVVPLKGAFLRGWYCKNRWQQSTTHPSTHPSLKRICCIPAQILNRWQANGVPRGIRSQHFKRLQQCLIDRCLCQKETSKKTQQKHSKPLSLSALANLQSLRGSGWPMILSISRMKTKRFVHISSFKSFLAKAPGRRLLCILCGVGGWQSWPSFHTLDQRVFPVDQDTLGRFTDGDSGCPMALWCMFCSLASYPYIVYVHLYIYIYILLHVFVNLSFYLWNLAFLPPHLLHLYNQFNYHF